MELSHILIAGFVRKAQAGSSDAFAQLYTYTYDKVYNYCRHYLKDDYLAQDAVQEIYISAFKNLNKLNDPSLFIAWINQISFHTCYDLMKARKEGYEEADPELLEEISDVKPDSSPEGVALKKDESQRLKEALNKLTPNERELITLRYYNGMKIDEIVTVTEISRSTVKRQLISATEKLKKLMKD